MGSSEKHWHAMSIEEVLNILGVDPAKGLTEEEAKKRLEEYGPNEIVARKKKPFRSVC